MHPKLTIIYILYKYMSCDIKSEIICDALYTLKFNRKINWDNPEDLNQWIAWLQFKTDTSIWSTLADKYRVQDFLKEKGFDEYIVPILAKWDSADNINLDNLPNNFVLKCNNGCGDAMVVKDKSKVDICKIKNYFRNQMSRDFGKNSAEPHYRVIKPLIIAEKFLDPQHQPIRSSSLIDYKFWCFNGKVDRIFVCTNRTKQCFTVDLYNLHWHRIVDENISYNNHHLKAKIKMPKPVNFEKMVSIASEISKGFPQMRIDFYEIDDILYIGELTMTSLAGRMDYFTEKCLSEMGKLCEDAVKTLKTTGQLNIL